MNTLVSSRRHGLWSVAFACLAAVGLLAGCGKGPQARGPMPPPEVSVATVTSQRLPIISELPGRIDPVRVAEVRARVAGILLHRVFEEGSNVKAGQVLFEIDPAPFKASLESADASLAKARAAAFQARTLANRYKSLLAADGVSRQDYDNAEAGARQAEAEVLAAKAAVTTARLNLGYATVTAPISGHIGAALVTEGALVGQNEATPLATIQQTDPVYFDFTQSSNEVLRLRRAIDSGRIQRVAPGAAEARLVFDDGTEYSHPGKLLFSDITVDPGTGMVTLRAEFPNPDGMLLPGMFARIRLEQGVQDSAIIVPMRAVTRGENGTGTAFVVGPGNKVELRTLKLGDATGENWVVYSGLRAGETVIVEGLQKVRPGMTVHPVPFQSEPDAGTTPGTH
ncbi:multidrug resistance protein MexA precursor [mine drainage metagenome]|uniref:Multidrug resistance protein MexA n=1 Tax=mine drainage metagenome TaxID=410659 RepID=A0A1J5S075_9ZZZZ